MSVERRSAPAAEAGGRTVAGVAVPYGTVTYNTAVPERFLPRSFKRSLDHKKHTIKVFRNHDNSAPVAVGKLSETDSGLLIEAVLADTGLGDETVREVRAGLLDSFSVGFRAIRERVVDGVREIQEAALTEVSLVALPAYEGARVVSVRNAADLLPPRPTISDARVVIAGVVWQ